MSVMKLLRYAHGPLRSLLSETSTLAAWVARVVLERVAPVVPWLARHKKLWALIGIALSLLLQVGLLWLLGEMIGLCITLMEVWTELAVAHYAITLDS